MTRQFLRYLFRGMAWLAFFAVCDVAMAKESAAKAWKGIEAAQEGLRKDADDTRVDPKLRAGQLSILQHQLVSFIREYPQDGRVWQARIILPEINCLVAFGLDQPVEWSEARAQIEALAADSQLPAKLRPAADYTWISLVHMQERSEELPPDLRQRLLERMEQFGINYPRHPMTGALQVDVGNLLASTDPERAAQAWQRAMKSGDERAAAKAETELAALPYRSRPLDLQFVALDGAPVNLADLRGKVVLVDFWATWCGPCIKELPQVIGVYERYHDRGFEIVGISFDDNRQALREFIAERRMPWMQYYDGGGWDNRIGRRFAISSIPQMWLLDRTGRITSTQIWGGNLEYHVKAQLEQP